MCVDRPNTKINYNIRDRLEEENITEVQKNEKVVVLTREETIPGNRR